MSSLARDDSTDSVRTAFKALRIELRWWFGIIAAILIAIAAKLYGIV